MVWTALNRRCAASYLTAGAASVLALTSFITTARAQTLLAEYNYDDSGTTTASTVANGPTLNLNSVIVGTAPQYTDNKGSSADLHGAAKSGVSGLSSDFSLALAPSASFIAATSTYNGGVASGPLNQTTQVPTQAALAGAFNTHTSPFTLQGWFNPASTTTNPTFNGGTRLIDANTFLVLATTGGILQLQIGGNTGQNFANSTGYAPVANQWEFWAITYSGASAGGIVSFYKGSTAANSSVSLLNQVFAIVPREAAVRLHRSLLEM